ncbi:MAG: aminotransferase class V-fold PLP-dependent enzyme [Phycisphaeraceae bacterium]|nr:aminotransferase class V-fold PLP-dependent enzyme [Phycisphaeraceae bacterium]
MDMTTQFPILEQMDFFNHAGVAPISHRAATVLQEYALEASSFAYTKDKWYPQLAQVKRSLAQLINARGEHEIAFVPNTSTGLSMIANGIQWHQGDNVIISDVEYPANRYPWENLVKQGVELIEVPQLPDGTIDAEFVCNAITNRTRVVSLSSVQYASGFRIDLKPIAQMIHHAGGYLCVDGIQSVGLIPLDVQAIGIDFLAADGHKWLLGPEGLGFLYVHEDLVRLLHPTVIGWHSVVNPMDFGNYNFELHADAKRFEPGTQNIPGVLALGASVNLLQEVGIDTVWQNVQKLNEQLCNGLPDAGCQVLSPRGQGQFGGSVIFKPTNPEVNPKRVVAELQKQNIIAVVREGCIRVSPHFYNQPQQIDRLLEQLGKLCR